MCCGLVSAGYDTGLVNPCRIQNCRLTDLVSSQTDTNVHVVASGLGAENVTVPEKRFELSSGSEWKNLLRERTVKALVNVPTVIFLIAPSVVVTFVIITFFLLKNYRLSKLRLRGPPSVLSC